MDSTGGFVFWSADTKIWAEFGSFLGAILLAFTLLYQIRAFRRQQVEAKFFEMLKYYRDNISEMRFVNPFSKQLEIIDGRRVIVLILKQYFFARNIIKSIINQGKWSKLILNADTNANKEYNTPAFYISDIAYQLVFWGVAS